MKQEVTDQMNKQFCTYFDTVITERPFTYFFQPDAITKKKIRADVIQKESSDKEGLFRHYSIQVKQYYGQCVK